MKFLERRNFAYFSKHSTGDLFYRFFLGHYCLGDQCHSRCKYKMCSSAADIRVGDFWGDTYKNNEDGVNAILAITELGENVLQKMSMIHIQESSIDSVTQGQMKKCAEKSPAYNLAMLMLRSKMPLKLIYNVLFIYSLPLKAFQKFKKILSSDL